MVDWDKELEGETGTGGWQRENGTGNWGKGRLRARGRLVLGTGAAIVKGDCKPVATAETEAG